MSRYWKEVLGYRLRVLFNWPYKNTTTVEDLLRRVDPEWARKHSCACGLTVATSPLNGQRMGCCPAQRDGSECARDS